MKKRKLDYVPGKFETQKFADKKPRYYEAMEKIQKMGYSFEDYMPYFPCFTGHMTLSRYFFLYDLYKKTLGISGHIAEVGVYKGGSLLFFTKLTQIFEPNSLTQVHGFDWFKGNAPDSSEKNIVKGSDAEPKERLQKLIDIQDLNKICFLHEVDVSKEISAFFEKNPTLQFKLIYLDAGMYKVVKAAIPAFWERLTKGGVMIFDQFNHEVAPGETKAVKEFFKDKEIRTMPYNWMPTAYIVK
jgi:hypothetical protein